jgi:hypothetical protein
MTDSSRAGHWIVDAPRRTHCVVGPATVLLDEGKPSERVLPLVAFGFLLPEGEPMLHVALVTTPARLRAFQRELDRAISVAIAKMNAMDRERRASRGGKEEDDDG